MTSPSKQAFQHFFFIIFVFVLISFSCVIAWHLHTRNLVACHRLARSSSVIWIKFTAIAMCVRNCLFLTIILSFLVSHSLWCSISILSFSRLCLGHSLESTDETSASRCRQPDHTASWTPDLHSECRLPRNVASPSHVPTAPVAAVASNCRTHSLLQSHLPSARLQHKHTHTPAYRAIWNDQGTSRVLVKSKSRPKSCSNATINPIIRHHTICRTTTTTRFRLQFNIFTSLLSRCVLFRYAYQVHFFVFQVFPLFFLTRDSDASLHKPLQVAELRFSGSEHYTDLLTLNHLTLKEGAFLLALVVTLDHWLTSVSMFANCLCLFIHFLSLPSFDFDRYLGPDPLGKKQNFLNVLLFVDSSQTWRDFFFFRSNAMNNLCK